MAVPQKDPTRAEVFFGTLMLGAIVYFVYLLFFSGPSQSYAERRCNDTVSAFVMSQGFIERRLRSPSTASFPYITDEGVRSVRIGECEFSVRAYVEAQNGFGAQVRTPYNMMVRYNPDSNDWSGWDINM